MTCIMKVPTTYVRQIVTATNVVTLIQKTFPETYQDSTAQ